MFPETRFLLKCLLTTVVVAELLSNANAGNDHLSSDHRFGYSRNRQKLWHEHHKKCNGEQQSPVHIVSHRAVPLPLRAVEMVGYHDPLLGPLNLTNNGHSVNLKPEGRTAYPPTVYGALLKDHYVMDSFHFHWGLRNYRGSEHRVNGIRYPMEMHVIHIKQGYGSVEEALGYPDGLTVLAFFFQLRERDNQQLQPLLKKLKFVVAEGQSVHLDSTFTMASLLPKDLDIYYTYRGSITTPPCSEVVTWIVFPEPQFISYRQLKKFRRLSSGESKMADNYRLLQDIGNRVVYVRRMFSKKPTSRNFTNDKLTWYN